MEFYNNYSASNFSPDDFVSDNYRANVKSFNDIYPSPSSSPTYQTWMSDMYNIKIESIVPQDGYAAPPSPPDSYQSIASPKLSVEYNYDNIFTDDKQFFTNSKQNSILFNETDVNIEPIISLVLEEAKLDSKSICELLKISLSKF